jgi:hypothetical protein
MSKKNELYRVASLLSFEQLTKLVVDLYERVQVLEMQVGWKGDSLDEAGRKFIVEEQLKDLRSRFR